MADQDYNKLTVVQIREIFKSRGIPATGLTRKQQLIDKLRQVDAEASQGPAPPQGPSAQPETQEPTHQQESNQDKAQAVTPVTEDNREQHVPPVDTSKAQGTPPSAEDATKAPDSEAPPPAAPEHTPAGAAPLQKFTEDTSPRNEEDVNHQSPEEPKAASKESEPGLKSPEPEQTSALKVLEEENHPSAPERVVSPPRSPSQEDSRKRKRRSLSPPPSEEEAQKRLKQNQDVVHLKEDNATSQAPPELPTQLDEKEDKAPLPDRRPEPEVTAPERPPTPASPEREESTSKDVSTSPSIHPATAALYIANLKRPLRPRDLEAVLIESSQPVDKEGADASHNLDLPAFYIDNIRTHALVLFPNTNAAIRTRSSLHNRVWPPDQPESLPLWIDFIPEDRINTWIATERDSTEMKRWEIAYHKDEESGAVTADLAEKGAQAKAPHALQRATASDTRPPAGDLQDRIQPRSPASQQRPRTEHPAHLDRPFKALDERFPSTKSKPPLYYLAVDEPLASQRRADFDDRASSKYRRTGPHDPSDELRRYTFQHGHSLVDAGPHREPRSRLYDGNRRRDGPRPQLPSRGDAQPLPPPPPPPPPRPRRGSRPPPDYDYAPPGYDRGYGRGPPPRGPPRRGPPPPYMDRPQYAPRGFQSPPPYGGAGSRGFGR